MPAAAWAAAASAPVPRGYQVTFPVSFAGLAMLIEELGGMLVHLGRLTVPRPQLMHLQQGSAERFQSRQELQ
jgi:hypothetical protein